MNAGRRASTMKTDVDDEQDEPERVSEEV